MSIITEALKKARDSSIKIDEARKLDIRKPEIRKPQPQKSRTRLLFYISVGFLATLLFLFSIYLLFNFFLQGPMKEGSLKEYSLNENSVVSRDKIEPIPETVQPVVKEEVAEKPLPFKSLSAGVADLKEKIKLNGIMYTTEKPLAIINDSTLGEEDYIGEFKIVKIGKDFVKISLDEKEFTLRLKK